MKNKSILMPHPCQWAGWGLLVLAVLTEAAKVLFVRDISVAWYFAKGAACAGTASAGAEVAGTAFAGADGTASAYLSELFVIVLPILLFVLYYGTFKWMLLMSRKQL